MQLSALILVALALATRADAFAPASVAPPTLRRATTGVATPRKQQSVELSVVIDTSLIDAYDMSVSRTAFFLCFFGAAGSAAIGRAVIPIVWEKYWDTQALVGAGNTLGGRVRA